MDLEAEESAERCIGSPRVGIDMAGLWSMSEGMSCVHLSQV